MPSRARAAQPLPKTDRLVDAAASLRRAEALLHHGEATDAHALAEQVLAMASVADDAPLRAGALLVRASASYQQAHYEAAYLSAVEAHDLLRASGDVRRALEATDLLVAVYCETGEFDRAVEAAKSGIELSATHALPTMTMRLLLSLGRVLHRGGEYPEAIRCLDEAIALHEQMPAQERDARARYTTELAFVHQAFGDHLAAHNQLTLAREHFDAARSALSAPLASTPAGPTVDEISSLEARVHLQATWGDWPGARRSAALFLRWARRRQSSRRTLAAAMNVLSTLHRARGDLPRAIRHQRRSLALLRELGLTKAAKESVQRLATLHADCGDHAAALDWQQQAARLQATETDRNHALRCRLAALERQAKRRGAIAREQLLHARRMMVIGRLIGRIHHAMLGPLQRADERITQAIGAVAGSAPSQVAALLRDAGAELDQAAALTRELKLFSYRSAPQLSALSLEESLRAAWHGLRLFGRSPDWSLSVAHDADGVEVLGDAQRVGILFTILLMELAPQSAGTTGRVIHAAVEHDSGSPVVTMTIGVNSDIEVAAEPSLGMALCVEIAQEMDGRLDCEYDGTIVRGYRLCLPFAQARPPSRTF
jgi:tetratricopeptide (TPR) repeat protein